MLLQSSYKLATKTASNGLGERKEIQQWDKTYGKKIYLKEDGDVIKVHIWIWKTLSEKNA